MNVSAVIFAPAFPWPVLYAAAVLALGLVAFAAWRGLAGWILRGLGALVLLTALAGPSLQSEERQAQDDILLVLVDESASQDLGARAAQGRAALQRLEAQVDGTPGLELHVARAGDSDDNSGTRLMTALDQALADLARERVAGAVLISDGLLHDLDAAPGLPAPLHLLLTGHADDWDRRLVVKNAPAFAILGEEQVITLRVEDQGAAPADAGAQVPLSISVDGGEPQVHQVPVGVDLQLPLTLTHAGMNLLRFELPEARGELTGRNNAAVVQINGVRDRLRVLLVTGVPHPGTRTWRNLLKSDSSVDLVHFTILRPPEKQDGVPVNELSLIAFPTQELFMQKIDEFDLIIFDRYKLRGILPSTYLGSVRDYVKRGGAVLVAAGPDFATVDSLARSPLSEVLPAQPTSRVIETGFVPLVSDLGARHPVTRGIEKFGPEAGWGRWFRLIELTAGDGQVVMEGAGGAPLLALDRVGEGRVALLASDHAWLWARGLEGGGPQLELLRRLAHWMMGEPELDEEALRARAEGNRLTVTRQTLGESVAPVTVTGPDGVAMPLVLEQAAPGLFRAEYLAPAMGLYRLDDGALSTVAALGPSAPREFESTIASGEAMGPVLAASNGGVLRLEAGQATLRAVRPGRPAVGRGWVGYTPRGAYITLDVRVIALTPAWLMLLLAAGLVVLGWLWEGRGRRASG